MEKHTLTLIRKLFARCLQLFSDHSHTTEAASNLNRAVSSTFSGNTSYNKLKERVPVRTSVPEPNVVDTIFQFGTLKILSCHQVRHTLDITVLVHVCNFVPKCLEFETSGCGCVYSSRHFLTSLEKSPLAFGRITRFLGIETCEKEMTLYGLIFRHDTDLAIVTESVEEFGEKQNEPLILDRVAPSVDPRKVKTFRIRTFSPLVSQNRFQDTTSWCDSDTRTDHKTRLVLLVVLTRCSVRTVHLK